MVGREGFEPPTASLETPGLQPGAFNHFATYPLDGEVVIETT